MKLDTNTILLLGGAAILIIILVFIMMRKERFNGYMHPPQYTKSFTCQQLGCDVDPQTSKFTWAPDFAGRVSKDFDIITKIEIITDSSQQMVKPPVLNLMGDGVYYNYGTLKYTESVTSQEAKVFTFDMTATSINDLGFPTHDGPYECGFPLFLTGSPGFQYTIWSYFKYPIPAHYISFTGYKLGNALKNR